MRRMFGTLTQRPVYAYDSIYLNSSYNKKCLRQILQKKSRHVLCSKLVPQIRAVHEKTWRNIVEVTNDNIIRRMRCACWITKAANTLSEYVILPMLFHGKNGYMNAPQYYVYMCIGCLYINRAMANN